MGYARDMAEHYAEQEAIERDRSRDAALDALHKAALAVAYAHERGGFTDDEAETVALACDELGQGEPLAGVMKRLEAKLEAWAKDFPT